MRDIHQHPAAVDSGRQPSPVHLSPMMREGPMQLLQYRSPIATEAQVNPIISQTKKTQQKEPVPKTPPIFTTNNEVKQTTTNHTPTGLFREVSPPKTGKIKTSCRAKTVRYASLQLTTYSSRPPDPRHSCGNDSCTPTLSSIRCVTKKNQRSGVYSRSAMTQYLNDGRRLTYAERDSACPPPPSSCFPLRPGKSLGVVMYCTHDTPPSSPHSPPRFRPRGNTINRCTDNIPHLPLVGRGR